MIDVSRGMLSLAYEAVGESAPYLTTPAERVHLLAALLPRLLALDGGAQRLVEWTPRAGPDEPLAQLRRRLRHDAALYGDGAISDVVIDTLATIVPPPVREWAIREVAFCLVGWECGAWTLPLALRGSRLVVMTGAGRDADAIAHLVCHEIVHGWHALPRVLADLPTLTAPHEQLILAVAQEGAWPALAELPLRERITDATALSWFCAADRAPAAP